MKKVSLNFKELEEKNNSANYSDGCSGSRSDCCTRVCTKAGIKSNDDSLKSWDNYLEVNAGVIQY